MTDLIDEVIAWVDATHGCPPAHEAQLRALDSTAWRRVEDGPPEKGVPVLVYSSEDHQQTAVWYGYGWSCDGNGIFSVTHWRPLPEGPGE